MNIDFDKLRFFTPRKRRILLCIIDISLLVFSIWLSFWLRLGSQTYIRIVECLWLFPSTLISGISVYSLTGQYRGLTRHLSSDALYQIAARNLLIILIVSSIGVMGQFRMPPRSSWLLLWIVISIFTGSFRFVIRDILQKNRKRIESRNKSRNNIVIYGAGSAGAKLAASIKNADKSKLLFFIDDSPFLTGRTLDGIPIKSRQSIKDHKSKISQILIAISSISTLQKKQLAKNLNYLNIPIQIIPSIEDIISNKFELNHKNLLVEDLLGRQKVKADPILLSKGIKGQSILITGAGGSIGSELCTQIIKLNPLKIVLLELNEHALYNVEKDLRMFDQKNILIKTYLGSASNEHLVENIFKVENIDIVFHTAAYKHVPIVELNPIVGIKNNVFSTKVICNIANNYDISKVILISSDKAVRPSNVMGASKRLSELIIQGYANKNSKTKFSMVRFGNVLNSSGSVIPIFKDQISKGGPLTITHPKITRYFMTIEEASQLVIQATELALGGDLFVLDMGKPIKIVDLAEQMIKINGLKIKNEKNPKGDIEIIFTGLRPGEKLYEELLIDAECLRTEHPLIYRAIEKSIDPSHLWNELNNLEKEINKFELNLVISSLSKLVPEWKSF